MRLCKFTFTVISFLLVCILFGMPSLHPFTFLMFLSLVEKMNVTEQARVGKDQVGNGVKETTMHSQQPSVGANY